MTESSNSVGKKLRLNENTSWERGESSSATTNDNSAAHIDDSVDDPLDINHLLWQEIQLARCIEDNTTNSLLEPYRHLVVQLYSLRDEETPPSSSTQSRLSVDNSGMEESAILTAIHEHGLQNFAPFEEQPYICHPLPPTPDHEPSVSSLVVAEEVLRSPTPPSSTLAQPPSPAQPAQLFMNESDHLYFMEAAVAVAIQKKGLTPYSVSMSPTR